MYQSPAERCLLIVALVAASVAVSLLIVSLAEPPNKARLVAELILAFPLALYALFRRWRWQR